MSAPEDARLGGSGAVTAIARDSTTKATPDTPASLRDIFIEWSSSISAGHATFLRRPPAGQADRQESRSGTAPRDRRRVQHREQPPFAGHPYKGVGFAVGKPDPRARDQVLHRRRGQHLSRFRQRHDAGPSVYGDAAHVVPQHLALTGVQPRPQLQTERLAPGDNRLSAGYGAGRAVEGGEEPVSSGLHLAAAEALQLVANHGVVVQ